MQMFLCVGLQNRNVDIPMHGTPKHSKEAYLPLCGIAEHHKKADVLVRGILEHKKNNGYSYALDSRTP